MGVCIETLILIYKTLSYRHTLYGCVYWNSNLRCLATFGFGHTLYGCVYWNKKETGKEVTEISHTLYGCVYWNNIPTSVRPLISSHTLYGCVYWNRQIGSYSAGVTCVTPYMGVCIETTSRVQGWSARRCHTLYGCVYWNNYTLNDWTMSYTVTCGYVNRNKKKSDI